MDEAEWGKEAENSVREPHFLPSKVSVGDQRKVGKELGKGAGRGPHSNLPAPRGATYSLSPHPTHFPSCGGDNAPYG